MRRCPICNSDYPDSAHFCGMDGAILVENDEAASPKGAASPKRAAPGAGTLRTIDFTLEEDERFYPYQPLQLLGRGSMGSVYLAEHVLLGRKVALKVLHETYAKERYAVERFFAEARAVNTIHHENIIEITDFVDRGPRTIFFVMELLHGISLQQAIRAQGALALERTLSIGLQLSDALAEVHRAGIVHRDLKPDNVFLTPRGDNPDFVKILDFGVAKLEELSQRGMGRITDPGSLVGTPAYMSPEQARGQPADARSDIYALGVTLFETVTGRLPFDSGSVKKLLYSHRHLNPPRPSSIGQPRGKRQRIPPRLEDLILACLQKEPKLRPDSMLQVKNELEEVGAFLLPRDASVTAVIPQALVMTNRSLRAAMSAMVLAVVAMLPAGNNDALTEQGQHCEMAVCKSSLSPGPARAPNLDLATTQVAPAGGRRAGAAERVRDELSYLPQESSALPTALEATVKAAGVRVAEGGLPQVAPQRVEENRLDPELTLNPFYRNQRKNR